MKSTYNPEIHHRHSIRLKDYDYSQLGAYFITICTYKRECKLGEIIDDKIIMNTSGEIVKNVWLDLPKHYSNIELDEFIIMPNHVHGIIFIVGAGLKPAPTEDTKGHPLSEIIRGFKTFSSRRINEKRSVKGVPFWQRNYFEHVIRNDSELKSIREYIRYNPLKWQFDKENPDYISNKSPVVL